MPGKSESRSRTRIDHHFLRRIRILAGKPDVRSNPVKAIWRRVTWHLRWLFVKRPWALTYRGRLRIFVMKDGLGAGLYYQGFTEPDVEDFLVRFLKPGMTFVDVGAHAGKYTLLGAAAVGTRGAVIAFEPNAEIRRVLDMNVRANGFGNVTVYGLAIADAVGVHDFEVCAESSVSSLAGSGAPFPRSASSRVIRVKSTTLDAVLARSGGRADCIKVDVEGAELSVLRGAGSLMKRPAAQAPVFIFEYEQHNYLRFGYGVDDVFAFLTGHGYAVYYNRIREGLVRADPMNLPADVNNLIAAKEGAWPPGKA